MANKRKKKKNNNNKLYIATIIILIIIILLLLWFYFMKKGKTEYKLIPDRAPVEFNINISCGCNEPDKCDNKPTNNTSNKTKKKCNTSNFPVIHIDENEEETVVEEEEEEEPPTIIDGRIYVDDVDGDYLYHQTLPIFNNEYFNGTNKIAPGVSGSYDFKVHNESDTNLKYYIKMTEKSEYKVNLKYRLKKEGEYVLGSDTKWVSAKELKTKFSNIDIEGIDNYTLDWKWFDDDKNDYKAGKYMTSDYSLKITIHIESI